MTHRSAAGKKREDAAGRRSPESRPSPAGVEDTWGIWLTFVRPRMLSHAAQWGPEITAPREDTKATRRHAYGSINHNGLRSARAAVIIGDIADTFDVIGWLIVIALTIIALCWIYWAWRYRDRD